MYARASARIPVAEQGRVRDLELGKAVERVRVGWRPRLRFLRSRSILRKAFEGARRPGRTAAAGRGQKKASAPDGDVRREACPGGFCERVLRRGGHMSPAIFLPAILRFIRAHGMVLAVADQV